MTYQELKATLAEKVSEAEITDLLVCISDKSPNFTGADIVGMLIDMTGIGASKSRQKIQPYHSETEITLRGGAKKTINDTTINCMLTKEMLTEVVNRFEDDTKLYIGVFDAVNDFEEIYSAYSITNSWSAELPYEGVKKLSYVLAHDKDFINATYTDEAVGE